MEYKSQCEFKGIVWQSVKIKYVHIATLVAIWSSSVRTQIKNNSERVAIKTQLTFEVISKTTVK